MERQLGLVDKHPDPLWAKWEFTPGADIGNLDAYEFRIDEARAPSWWTPQIEADTISEAKKVLAKCIVASGEHEAKEGRLWASGSASVTAYDSASVTASGSASVTAYDSASVTASGSASVRAYDSASVTAYDSASVTAYGSASVTAYDSASVVKWWKTVDVTLAGFGVLIDRSNGRPVCIVAEEVKA